MTLTPSSHRKAGALSANLYLPPETKPPFGFLESLTDKEEGASILPGAVGVIGGKGAQAPDWEGAPPIEARLE